MCGIAGLIAAAPVDRATLLGMSGSIAHRGPDDESCWIGLEGRVGLAHRRLAIVDLSPAGRQPMASADGRFILAYNGEIYNHGELRKALEAETGPRAWRGRSDTEVLVECVAAWGLDATLGRAVGMFAIALWDERERKLHLVRDRFGEKPLYFGWVGGDFVFASELKAIRTLPRFENPISRRALSLFAARAYIPAPFTIHERLFKLLPGHILSIDASRPIAARDTLPGPGEAGAMSLRNYWSYRDVVEEGLASPFGSEADADAALEAALIDAIAGQAVADVPVGAFLSGGIDSSTVVALYQKHWPGQVKTFTIGFEEEGFDEAGHANAVARHFGTEHHERYVTVREAQDVIRRLPAIYDEPFADSSQIPTHIVSAFAREHVTVALSGDGGDELFGGYNRHVTVPRAWAMARRIPRPLRAGVGGGLARVSPRAWDALAGAVPGWRRPDIGTKLRKGMRLVSSAREFRHVYGAFLDEWHIEGTPVLGADGDPGGLPGNAAMPDAVWAMYCDAMTYLPDDIMCKVDRASMAVSLETRAPFLDHRVAEVAARIPLTMKIAGGEGKQVLRRLLFRHAPRALFERPKAGFSVPIGAWLKGDLRDWAEALLDPRRLAAQGLFDPAPVADRWRRHLSGERESSQALWAILMFQAWLDDQHAGKAAPALTAA